MSRLMEDLSSFPSTASTSQEDHEIDSGSTSSRKLRVTLLSSEWRSTKGGLSTINRDLAIQLAKHPSMEVSVYLPQCSEEDKQVARDHNVRLIKAREMPGLEPNFWLSCLPEDHVVDCVIGHGAVLGRQVQFIKRTRPYCKWIQVVHTTPEELGMYKGYEERISKGEKKHQVEIELCKLADQVVAVGPKLAEAFSGYLRPFGKDQDVLNLTPGIFSEFSDVRQATEERKTFSVLMFGRGDSEDFQLKGYDIAAQAIAELKDMTYKLVFVGATSGEEEKVADLLLQQGIDCSQLTVRCFNENREQLGQLFCEVDLAIMPSRTEGFGLAALEALSAGLPVLVSGNSGLGEALKEVSNGSNCVVKSKDPKDWANAIRVVREKKRKLRLREARLLQGEYTEMYSWQDHCNRLVERMLAISQGPTADEQNLSKKATVICEDEKPSSSEKHLHKGSKKGKRPLSPSSTSTSKVPKCLGDEEVLNSKNVKVYWERKGKADVTGANQLAFDGIPYVHIGEKILWCHQGKDKRKKKDPQDTKSYVNDHCYKRKRTYTQVSKKKNCPVAIHIQQIAKFPNFKVHRDTPFFRATAAKQLHQALNEKKAGNAQMKYLITLPDPSQHRNHITGKAAGIREPVDPMIKEKIVELSHQGVRKVSEMRRHLEAFVKIDLLVRGQVLDKMRRRFFPTNKDIYNHMYRARVAHRFSALDQKNLDALIVQWNKDSPSDAFFYRPHSTNSDGNKENDNDSKINAQEDTPPDEVPDPAPSASEDQTLLFCHQTVEQRELLKKYGDQMCLMDATYRTTKYALPLYFLCVRTNVRYQVVGSFVIQYENKRSIEEALNVFKKWNPNWCPAYFMVDFAEEEIQALENVFSGSKVLLCDFHREKAWLEWTSKSDNGVASIKETILDLLRKVAHAVTTTDCAAAVKNLQNSKFWNDNEKLRKWFGKKWLPNIERWCQAYRNDDFVAAVNTNNGIERQNESLKYDYLTGYKNCSLSEMLTVLITQFIPDSYRKYIELNVQCHEGYRSYKDEVPPFLHNRPRKMVSHIMERWETDISTEHISIATPGVFNVKRGGGKQSYEVRYGDDKNLPHCQCPDWRRYRLPCKHLCACIKAFPEQWGWEQLGSKYTSNPLFCLDDQVISDPSDTQLIEATTSDTCICTPVEDDIHVPNIEDDGDFCSLAPKSGYGKAARRVRCRNILKEITHLTYLIKDEQALGQLEEDLANILGNAKESAPQEGGIHVIKESPKKSKKRKAARSSQGNPPQKKRKILDVKTTKYGRKKHPFTNRVGQHAETMRKMYRVHVSIPTNTSDAVAAVTASSKTMPGAAARVDTSKPKMHGGDKTSGDVPKVPAIPASSKTMPGAPARADMSKPKMHRQDKTSGDVPKVPTVPASSQNAKQPETTSAQMSHLQLKVFIDLTGNHISPQMKPSWIPAFNLLEEDKNILLHGQKLTDKHISACQKLLKKQFPQVDGLLDTILLSNNDIPCPPTQEALQMHHIPGHWVMSCSFGGNVTVYDSANTTLTPPLRRQLARVYSLLASGPDKLIEVTVKRCQKQIGGNDCGLFAVANAVALLRGVDPATVKFQQPKMRQHLQECLEKHVLTMFPHSTSNPTNLPTVSRKEIVSLHCLCKKHYPGSKTFQCSSCKVTFHTMCVKHNSVNRPHCTEDLCPPCQG